MRIFLRNFASLAIGILFISFTTFASAATLLPPDEVEALNEIGKTLGKTNWNFSVGAESADPCNYSTRNPDLYKIGFEDSVNCTCNGTVCNIIRIALKAQNLQGTLPPELARLTYLEDIDLSRNYLNGTIPPEWGSMMKLEKISLLGNRLTGPIPIEFGNISTLASISLEFNQLSGRIPPKLGSLPRLWKLHLTSNNFTEELPKELANLTNLQEFLIGDNHFTGKIPDFIQNWVHLTKFVILGSGLGGPIPPGIGLSTKLSELRISDLNGSQPSFPHVNLTSLKTLILRSCNINGPLPEYLGTMTNLKLLDLSFNNLSGKIPDNFIDLSKIDYMYLTGNLLSGPVLSWMLATSKNIDLSYNNFSFETSQDCPQGNTNLFGSSSKGNFSENDPCLSLRGFPCNKKRSSFHINCGGKKVSLNGKLTYEDDGDHGGPSNSNYRSTTTNWAYSSTGNFMEDNRTIKSFTLTNSSILSMKNSELYMDAWISPISLTYYGFCLVNGNYTINLHFAEIMFNDSKTYSSLGRRIFDIYIQVLGAIPCGP